MFDDDDYDDAPEVETDEPLYTADEVRAELERATTEAFLKGRAVERDAITSLFEFAVTANGNGAHLLTALKGMRPLASAKAPDPDPEPVVVPVDADDADDTDLHTPGDAVAKAWDASKHPRAKNGQFGETGESHPLGQKREEQTAALHAARVKGDKASGFDHHGAYPKGGTDGDPLGYRAEGFPEGVDQKKFTADVVALLADTTGGAGLHLDTLYSLVGKKYDLSKHEFARAMTALDDDSGRFRFISMHADTVAKDHDPALAIAAPTGDTLGAVRLANAPARGAATATEPTPEKRQAAPAPPRSEFKHTTTEQRAKYGQMIAAGVGNMADALVRSVARKSGASEEAVRAELDASVKKSVLPSDDIATDLLAVAMDVAEQALADGSDAQDLLDDLHALTPEEAERIAAGVVGKAIEWKEHLHPRAKNGRFISLDRIDAARRNPEKADALRKEVKPEDRKKLEDALSEKADVGRTKRGQERHDARQARIEAGKRVTADRDKARAIRDRLMLQSQRGEKLDARDLRQLIPHLSTMTGAELAGVRLMLSHAGASFGGATKVDERRARLLAWAKGEEYKATSAEVPKNALIDDALSIYDPEREAEARKTLGPNASGELVARASGAPPGTPARIASVYDGAVTVLAGPDYDGGGERPESLVLYREFQRDKNGALFINNVQIALPADAPKGEGTRLFADQVKAARELGAAYMTADGSKTDGENGYYTLPRWGYDAPVPAKSLAKLPPELKAGLGSAPQLSELMATEAGRKWWKENGEEVKGLRFDLAPDSPSMKTLGHYTGTDAHGHHWVDGQQVKQPDTAGAVAIPELRRNEMYNRARFPDADDPHIAKVPDADVTALVNAIHADPKHQKWGQSHFGSVAESLGWPQNRLAYALAAAQERGLLRMSSDEGDESRAAPGTELATGATGHDQYTYAHLNPGAHERVNGRAAPMSTESPVPEPKPSASAPGAEPDDGGLTLDFGDETAPDPAARAKAARAAHDALVAQARPIADKFNAAKPGKARDKLGKQLDALDPQVAASKTALDAAHEALAEHNGHDYGVYVVDGPGRAPRLVSRHPAMGDANSVRERTVASVIRGDSAVHSGQDITDEYGGRGGYFHSKSSGGKEVWIAKVARGVKKAFNEGDHPRGRPENAGEFTSGGGGTATAQRPKKVAKKTKDAPKPAPAPTPPPAASRPAHPGLGLDNVPPRAKEIWAEKLKAALGPDAHIEDLGAIAGAPSDAKITVDAHPRQPGITLTIDHPTYTSRLKIDRDADGPYLYVDWIGVKPEHQGKGLGEQIFAAQVAGATKTGATTIRLHGAKANRTPGAAPFNGYITWAKYGFDQSLSDPKGILPHDVPVYEAARKAFPDAHTVQELIHSPGGLDWWAEHGTDATNMRFDLANGSVNRIIFDAYRTARSAKKQVQS